jgi:hypothetical protein
VDDDISPPPPTAHVGANSNGKKKVQVLQEKGMPANAPRKRKDRIKTLLDPSARDENEHEPPRKKSRRTADPSTTKRYAAPLLFTINTPLAFLSFPPPRVLNHDFLLFTCCISRGAKENKEMSRSAREAARIAMDKVRLRLLNIVVEVMRWSWGFFLLCYLFAQPLPSPVKQPAARPKPASEAKKPASCRAGPGVARTHRSRGLPLDVLRRIKVNALTLPALNDIDDDDPIDFLRSWQAKLVSLLIFWTYHIWTCSTCSWYTTRQHNSSMYWCVINYSNSFPCNIICSTSIEKRHNEKRRGAEDKSCTIYSSNNDTSQHKILLYTAIVLTFGRLRGLGRSQCLGFRCERRGINTGEYVIYVRARGDVEGDLTFSFGFPLRCRGFALCTDLCEAGKVGFSFVGLALDVQLATPYKYRASIAIGGHRVINTW